MKKILVAAMFMLSTACVFAGESEVLSAWKDYETVLAKKYYVKAPINKTPLIELGLFKEQFDYAKDSLEDLANTAYLSKSKLFLNDNNDTVKQDMSDAAVFYGMEKILFNEESKFEKGSKISQLKQKLASVSTADISQAELNAMYKDLIVFVATLDVLNAEAKFVFKNAYKRGNYDRSDLAKVLKKQFKRWQNDKILSSDIKEEIQAMQNKKIKAGMDKIKLDVSNALARQ